MQMLQVNSGSAGFRRFVIPLTANSLWEECREPAARRSSGRSVWSFWRRSSIFATRWSVWRLRLTGPLGRTLQYGLSRRARAAAVADAVGGRAVDRQAHAQSRGRSAM
jgi:hypothetical protein